MEAGFRLAAAAECGECLRWVPDEHAALFDEFEQVFQGFWHQARAVGQPQQAVADAFRGEPAAIAHRDAVKQGVRIAIVIAIAFRKGCGFRWLVVAFIAKIPQHVRHRVASL